MAWGSNEELKFNISEIISMRSKIQSTSSELRSFKNKLASDFEQLKKDWNTPAGKKFISEFDTDWAKEVDKYIKIMIAVDELLKVAEEKYREVEESAKNIQF